MTKTEKGKKNKQFLSAFDVNLKYNIEYPKIPFKWPHCIWRETTCIERGTDNTMTKTEKGKKNKQFLSASDVNLKYNIEYPKIPFKWPHCIWRETTCIERGTDNAMTKTEKGQKNKQCLSASDVNLKYNIEYPKIPFKWPYCIWRKKTHVQYRGMIVLRVSIIAI